MKTWSGFDAVEVEFTKTGAIHDREPATELVDVVRDGGATDLLVLAHGWNNDMAEARGLYERLLEHLRARLDAGGVAGVGDRRFSVLAVLWPSKRFADVDLIASGAASGRSPVTDDVVRAQLDELKGTFTATDDAERLERAKALVGDLEDRASARREFADLIRSLLPRDATDPEDASEALFDLPGDEVFQRLSKPVLPAAPGRAVGGVGGATGGAAGTGSAAGIGEFFAGMRSAARNLLNYATYYQMKERAGAVGRGGVSDVLRAVRTRRPDVRLHLVGHSFGGRLVTAAAAGPAGVPPLRVDSLTLLQAAFSHHGFAHQWDGTRDGLFRPVLTEQLVSGPVLISHTANDRAVGIAYPLASLLAGHVASGLGDRNSRFGGIGRNGAQKTPEAVDETMLAAGDLYAFRAGTLHNLRADAYISDHGDVASGEVAHAVVSAIATT